MFRDFSESAKTKLLDYVKEVTAASTWEKISDAIGDAGAHVQNWLGWLNISRYVNDLDNYHKKVLDKDNITATQINTIFDNVDMIDQRYEKGLSGELTTSKNIDRLIRHLAATINPNGGNLNMAKMAKTLQADIEAIQESKVLNQTIIEDEMLGTNPEGASTSVDPVNLSTGNFIYEHEDLHVPGEIELSFHRYYNSKDIRVTSLGKAFRHNYDICLKEENNRIDITLPDGQHRYFEKDDTSGEYVGINAAACMLSKSEESYQFIVEDGTVYLFDLQGKLYRIEDTNSRGISFWYSEEHNLSKAENDNGDYLEYTYSKEGLLEKVTDRCGRKVSIQYENERIKSVIMPENVELHYSYAANGRVNEVINSKHVISVQNKYDNKFRVIRQKFPDGGVMEFEYNDALNQVIQTERDGSKTIFVHDDQYRNTEIIYSDGTSEKFLYNERNQCICKTDRNGNTIRMAYDNRGNMTQIIDAGKSKANITYDNQNRLLTVSVNGKLKLKNWYDKKGNLVAAEDALGNVVRNSYDTNGRKVKEMIGNIENDFSYDDKGNLALIMCAQGTRKALRYDELNRVVETVDANGNIEKFSYDAANRIIEVTNAEGNRRSFEYNTSGKTTRIIDYDGYEIRKEYDECGRLLAEIDKEGKQTLYTYDKMWNVVSVKKPGSGMERYEYDSDNRLCRVILPEGGEMEYTYDSVGNRVGMKDPEGNVTKYEYNSDNMLVKATEANGAVTRYEYDLDGNLVRIYDALNNEVSFSYDAVGNRTSYTDENGFTTKMEYILDGRVSCVIYPNGGIAAYEYDEMGRLKCYREPSGKSEEYQYDLQGNLLKKKNTLGEEVSFAYDCMNRIVKMTNPSGGVRIYTYDKVGNMTSVKDENGNTTLYEYSPNGNLMRVITANQAETLYTYDEAGNIQKIIKKGEDQLQETEFEWDLLGNIRKIRNPLGDVEEYIYNKCGQLIKKIDQDNFVTQYQYDKVGQLNEIVYSDNRKVHFSYNLLKQLEIVDDWVGRTSIQVDKTGMPLCITNPDGKRIQYEWGSMGEKRKVIYSDGETALYEYNEANQLIKMYCNDEITEYQYDEMGRFCGRYMPNGFCTQYQYNELGRISSIYNRMNNDLIESYEYKYDLAGNKIQAVIQRQNALHASGVVDYRYDNMNRLFLVSKDGEKQREYRYDAFGNRILKNDFTNNMITKYLYNANNQLMSENSDVFTRQYGYDHRGNLVKIMQDSKPWKEYFYDASNRLSLYTEQRGEETPKTVQYTYNGLGKKVESRVQHRNTDKRVAYVMDLTRKCHNLLERVENTNKRQVYFYDGKVMGAMSNNGIGYYLSDDHGSPSLYAEGERQLSYVYDEFGVSSDNDFSSQPFGYTGYLFEEECGLYDAHARTYQPELGRFASEDKVRGFLYQPITQNRYVYCCNKPEDFEDDDGEWLTVAIGAAVGGLVSAAVSITTQTIEGVKSGKSITESLTSVDYKKVAIETVKGAAKGAIAGTGLGIVTMAAANAGIDMIGDVAEQTIVDGKSITEVDKSQVVETGVFSFGFSLTLGAVSSKVSGAIAKKIGIKTSLSDLKGREIAMNTVKGQLERAKAKSLINKLTGRLADRTKEYWKTAGKYTLNKAFTGVYGIIQGDVYKKKLKNWVTGEMDEFYHCELAA